MGDCCSETQDFGQSEKTSQRNRAERCVFLFGSVVFGQLAVVYIRFLKNFGSRHSLTFGTESSVPNRFGTLPKCVKRKRMKREPNGGTGTDETRVAREGGTG